MHTITEVEKTIYLNKPDYDHMMRYPESVRDGYPKKTRGINIDGVMKNSKCYHVVLDEEYLKHIQSKYKTGGTSSRDHTSIYIASVIRDIFPNQHIFIHSSLSHHPVSKIDSSCKYNVYYTNDNVCTDTYTGSTYKFDVWDMDNWIECPKIKAELDRIKAEEERKSIEKLNITCLTDTITAALKEADINVTLMQRTYLHKNRAFMQAIDKKEWNKLLLKAINVYLNDIANKHGFKVAMPKIKSNAKINEYCPLFFLDDIEILNEGEQK
jgi:hypothetical protein